jgi:hypothetical protein
LKRCDRNHSARAGTGGQKNMQIMAKIEILNLIRKVCSSVRLSVHYCISISLWNKHFLNIKVSIIHNKCSSLYSKMVVSTQKHVKHPKQKLKKKSLRTQASKSFTVDPFQHTKAQRRLYMMDPRLHFVDFHQKQKKQLSFNFTYYFYTLSTTTPYK